MSHKNKKQREFDIPIKIFGSSKAKQRENASADEEQNNDIVPVMVENADLLSDRQPPPKGRIGGLSLATGEIDGEKTKKQHRLNAPMPWIEKKTKDEKIKLMWAIVGSFMAIIIFVWAIFLKYNIMLEKLSLKQLEKEEEWEEVKENFEKSMGDFQKMLSEVKNGTAAQSQPSDEEQKTSEPEQTEVDQSPAENKNINLTDENIEKLKERLMDKK